MIGTHNSLSYLKPRKWWQRLWFWAAKCQNETLRAQWDKGASVFDIRVRPDSKGEPVIAHGAMEYKGDVKKILGDFMTGLPTEYPLTFRLVLETNLIKDDHKEWFNKFFEELKAYFAETDPGRAVNFIGGHRKGDWAKLLDIDDPDIYQYVGSMQSSWYGKIWPWLWAKRHAGGVALDSNDDCAITLVDFIGMHVK